MASSRVQTKSLDRLVSIAKAYPGIIEVHQGYSSDADDVAQDPEAVDCPDLYARVAALAPYTQGILYLWLKEANLSYPALKSFMVSGELLINVPKDESNSMTESNELALGLGDLFVDFTQNWAKGEIFPTCNVVLDRIETVKQSGIAYYTYDIKFLGGDA